MDESTISGKSGYNNFNKNPSKSLVACSPNPEDAKV
jgi:hypothetical protein